MGQRASLLAQLLPEPAHVKPYVHPSQYREVPNVRHYSDGMHKQYQPNLCTLAISIITLGLYISVPHLLLGLMLASFFSRAAAVTLLLLMASLAIPARPLRVPQVLSSYLFLCWRRYFKFSYLFETSLDSYQDYVVAQFPHGAFPLGALIGGTFMATEYPEYPCYALAANAAFLVPVWCHVHAWLGTEACTKTNFHKLLGKGVKGPLTHRTGIHHSQHSLGHQQQQQQQHDEVATTTAAAAAAAQGTAGPDSGKSPAGQQRSPKPIGGTPFNSCAAALAAAADGVTAEPAAAAAEGQLYGPVASAAVIGSTLTGAMTEAPAAATGATAAGGGAGSRSGFVAPRRTSSAPLGRRLSQALSLTGSIFKGGHTLSDSDSSDSSDSSDGEGDEGEEACWEACCGCGSGLRCRDPEACGGRAANNINSISWGRGYSSDGGGSSRSSADGSICSCCGACTVLAEVHSLPPMDSFMRKQLQQQQPSVLVTIPSDETTAADAAAVEFDQRDQDSNSLSTTHLLLGQQQQQLHHHHHQQQQKQQLLLPHTLSHQQSLHSISSQVLRHDQTNPTNWRIDPVTGARKLGVSVGLMVGGIAEMFMIRHDHERIKLKDRKGFIRVSLEHGVDILPVYMFGVNQALDFGPPWLQRLSRRMRASLGMIYGVWGLPIPRRVPIFMVTGKPLTVGLPMRKDHPDFAAKVDELHAKFCEEIERLYYTHRGKYGHGFENRPLVIC